MLCEVHGIEMSWVEVDDLYICPNGGYWDCEECDREEESWEESQPDPEDIEYNWGTM